MIYPQLSNLSPALIHYQNTHKIFNEVVSELIKSSI